ncbi:hypothetical protein Lal_00018214 [Lupinus albus]|uniref:GIR1-like zinc ribbon domain-containing protein n=1 Tax=Lupinus albus TaxID=3870 RepID=A0A6A4N848_LUPAL|nr:hypothetical protein Lalb_Chr25g0284791 [Lupinus albus]KAF1866828.1 hypothetical protein Lal_00018214 [Lupinus albus]
MVTEVSSLIRVLGGYKEEKKKKHHNRTVENESYGEKSTALITRDLLGGSFIESQETEVPTGWEKRLDLKTGKVHIERCKTLDLQPMFQQKLNVKPSYPKLEDLHFPSSHSKVPLNLFDETTLNLNLFSSSNNYQSVCTLDKVKSALERVEKEPRKKRTSFSTTSPSYSSSSSSMKETQEESDQISSPIAVGCPKCLSYVLIMKNNPKCPRCNNVVPIPSLKKPRIDLNISI